jgi:hypothetical protein
MRERERREERMGRDSEREGREVRMRDERG